jgi:hypothetical protein
VAKYLGQHYPEIQAEFLKQVESRSLADGVVGKPPVE